MDIAKNIKRLREDRGLTQEELGKIAGVSSMAVSQWENERAVPRMGAIQALSDYFGVSKSSIMGDGDYVPPTGSHIVESHDDALVPVRVLGSVHAGEPDEGFFEDDTFPLPHSIYRRHKDCYALVVRGDCMDRVFCEGSVIMIDPNMVPKDGSIGVFLVDGEVVVRRLKRGASIDLLSPESHSCHDDIIAPRDGSVSSEGVVFWFQSASELS